jgi:hypothetical protein
MPPVKLLSPPIGGWRGLNPDVVAEVARLMAVRRHIAGDTATGRRLIAAWRGIDRDDPDPATYTRMVGELVPSEADFRAAFHSLLPVGEDD